MRNTNTLSAKRWYRLLPVAFITYSLAYLDRANFGFAAAGGMAEDIGITPALSSLLSSLFFLGYFFFQIPGAYYASKQRAKKLIFWSLILWGGLAAATGMVKETYSLIAIRFLLGVVESAVMPAMLILLSNWFTQRERSRANTFLILGNPATVLWMSVASGYLIDSLGWRWMFIIQGLPGILWAFCWWRLVDEKPAAANWLSDNEKRDLEKALHEEQTAIKPITNYGQAFRSHSVILLCAQYLLWNVGVYGFVMWLPSIIKSAPNISMVTTGWLSAVPYVFAIAGMLVASVYADKGSNRKGFIWPFLLVGALAFFLSYLIGSSNFWVSYILLSIAGAAMYTPYGPFFALVTEVLPRNVSGGAIGLINSMGALGSFGGAYLVGILNAYTQGFGSSYLFMALSLLAATMLTLLIGRKPRGQAAETIQKSITI
ncbi:MFS transporter [Sphingobacterium deserti]|uniref:Major facilitator superfamily MFS_1 n=1 Tax=Sphingobacterium deserti TaxID=1229276 RepID=A0A0B8TAJ3_9SPHI|nr:MFS transporter [Sphingobacterium deserti]KGE15130.1 major facilitator superfamily MFS_1 [Sphingobacterium deserti]